MPRRIIKSSITIPIALGSLSVALSIAMLVTWILVSLQNRSFTKHVAQNTWLLVGGIVSLVAIIGVLVALSVFLVREILEGRRQHTFIDSVTHELKSPLASIKLCVETLNRNALSMDQRLEIQRMMSADIERLSVFIDDILEASRLASDRRSYKLGAIHVASLVDRCAQAAVRRHRLPIEAIRIEVNDAMQVRSDLTALETVLKNLLDNALKYSDDPPSVIVRASEKGTRWTLEVEDQGIGMNANQQKRVFERFYRVPTERVRARKGTGLGLYVVASLVRGLGGRVTLFSPGIGCGTTISVELPMPPDAEPDHG